MACQNKKINKKENLSNEWSRVGATQTNAQRYIISAWGWGTGLGARVRVEWCSSSLLGFIRLVRKPEWVCKSVHLFGNVLSPLCRFCKIIKPSNNQIHGIELRSWSRETLSHSTGASWVTPTVFMFTMCVRFTMTTPFINNNNNTRKKKKTSWLN